MRVLGIDPGLSRLGFGLVEKVGGALGSPEGGTISTVPSKGTSERLLSLFEGLTETIERLRPDVIAVERVFFNLNVMTAVPVIRASGIALLAAARWGAEVHEYTPLEVKQAVVGTGAATKGQVRYMVQRLLELPSLPGGADTADALAVAICHIHSHKMRALAEAR